MIISSFCPPAIVYLVFVMVHVLMAIFDNNTKSAFLQAMMGVLFTLLLQFLCLNGLNVLSWIIVFLPLIFYTYIVILLYNLFGLGETDKNNQNN